MFKFDATAPSVTGAVPSRGPDSNGWYNHSLTLAFTGNDSTSGLVSCDSVPYTGPDTASANVSGRCRDNAGNSSASVASAAFKFDATAPTVTGGGPTRGPDSNGWFNHAVTVAFAGTDTTSGLASCDSLSFAGPDSAAASVSGKCRDNAGNSSPSVASSAFKFDATAPNVSGVPGRDPDSRGWYNHPLVVAFSGSDPISGIVSCTSTTYSGPDTTAAAVGGSCADGAGNVGAGALTVAYDVTPPSGGNATPERPADRNGWYNHPLPVSFAGGADATSGVESCSTIRYDGADSTAASVTGTCRDNAGNVSDGRSFAFAYDATPPAANATPARGPDTNGWYNHFVAVAFGGSDSTSGLEACSSGSYAGPDSASATVSGSCTDVAGNAGVTTLALKYDATAPDVTPRPARAPDGAGWYRQPLLVSFGGADAVSGIDTCTSATYAGPDAAAADVSGSCRDVAGNAATRAFTLRYDATPPKLGRLEAEIGDHSVKLYWTAAADAQVTVTRTGAGRSATLYTGAGHTCTDKGLKNGERNRYTVVARDAAGNTTSAWVDAVPLALFQPSQGARLREAPLLAWAKVAKASYYNVQVFHRGKVLSLWPKSPRVRMPREWTFGGRGYRLGPGLYRWYVWPGFGERAKSDYGKLIGSNFFVVAL